MKDVLAFVMAGGRGARLMPLTQDRTKPAVPFGGIYRLIDLPLSNCINSQVYKIIILPQYKSQSLHDHLEDGWNIFNQKLGHFLKIVPPQQRIGSDWYRGTADSIRRRSSGGEEQEGSRFPAGSVAGRSGAISRDRRKAWPRYRRHGEEPRE